MSRYNYDCLSPQDFEELIRDLLQAEWGVSLEAFRSGRDNGIDLRYSRTNEDTRIIQCKHFAASGFRKLLNELKTKEFSKIRLLNPCRYVVATTCGLTPANKTAVVATLAPFVLSPHDVIGANDLDGLLARHPAVERSNFKLWLTSTEVLERVVHNAELCLTDFQVDRVRRKLPLFVQSQAFPRAQEMLEKHRIVVISGVPGIGKTTLAEMLLYAHLSEGYEPVVIQAEVSDGRKFFRKASKQVFYYDDFLGQTFLGDRREYLGRNQDTAIVDFIEMVENSPDSRFILTTREHILSNALMLSERLRHSQMVRHRCILELVDYSTAQRARILYNHLYFSEIPPDYCHEMLRNDFFLTIIKHDHFSPRIIEWLASYTRLHAVPAAAYQQHVTELLESPEAIWTHAFNHQISNAARHVLISFYTLGQWVEITNLEPAFLAFHHYVAQKYNLPIRSTDFRNALQELDGAFLTYQTGKANFINPSIRDFLGLIISGDFGLVRDIIGSATRFRQVTSLWKLSQTRPNNAINKVFVEDTALLVQALTRLQFGLVLHWEKRPDGQQIGTYVDLSYEGRIDFLTSAANTLKSEEMVALADKEADFLIGQWEHAVPEVREIVEILNDMPGENWFFANGGKTIYLKLLDKMMDELYNASANDFIALIEFHQNAIGWTAADDTRLDEALRHYERSGASDDVRNCSDVSELSELRDALDHLHNKFGVNLMYEIGRLDEKMDEREERNTGFRTGERGGISSSHPSGPAISDDEMREMFHTLRNKF